MAGKELEVLVQCTKEMIDYIAATELISFTASLVASGLIPFQVKSEVDVLGTPQAKANKIVEAVTLTVKARASKFRLLIVVLNKNQLSDLGTILQDKWSKFRYNTGLSNSSIFKDSP